MESPQQGSVTFQTTTIGSTATYSCIQGYTLLGVVTRTCETNGEWSGSAPVCTAKKILCTPLPNVANGQVIITGNTVGSFAVYACNQGFKLVGENRRTCQPNGAWSFTEPFCSKGECMISIATLSGKCARSFSSDKTLVVR